MARGVRLRSREAFVNVYADGAGLRGRMSFPRGFHVGEQELEKSGEPGRLGVAKHI
jgi:hypothetical protein